MSESRTTTRRDLVRAGAVLIALTVLTAVLAFAAVNRAQRAADTVHDDTVPALLEVYAARGALIEADRAVMTSFHPGAVRLSGPGDEYRDQIAIASQNLTEAATHDVGDDSTERTLSLVNSLLTSYTGAIEQAAASFRHDADSALWTSDLWTASQLLHAGDGALALLDEVIEAQVDKLDQQVDAGTDSELGALVWLAPAVLLIVLLVGTQVWLRRRFRRTVNLGLAVATLLVAGMGTLSALVFDTSDHLHTTRDMVHRMTVTWGQSMAAEDMQGQRELAELIDRLCHALAGDCGSTVQRVVTTARSSDPAGSRTDQLTEGASGIEDQAGAATEHRTSLALIPIVATVAAVAIGLGLYQRFDEYRFRSR